MHSDPQVIANGYLPKVTDANDNEFALAASPVQFDEAPLDLTCAPGHGEHTDALLAELGFSEEEIIEFCRNQLARFKVPRTVVFGPLPKTSTGKMQKFILRERAKHL